MKQSPARLLIPALILFTLPLAGCKKAKQIAAQTTGSLGVSEPTYTDAIQAEVNAGHLDQLKWPDFKDLQEPVSTFYDNRNFTLAWSKEGKPTKQASALMEAFSNARLRGLEPDDYDAGKWQERVTALSSDQGKVLFDTAMTVNAARFINAVHMGRTDPKFFAFGIDSSSKQMDLPAVLDAQLVSSSDMDTTLDGFEPQTAQFKALRSALRHYIDLSTQDRTEALPDPGKSSITVTSGYPGLQTLQQKLALLGDLPGNSAYQGANSAPADVDVSAVTDAIKHFQGTHGIAQDGKLSHDTVAQLNTPISVRIAQISDTMERWRWLPDEYQKPAILVNLPEFELRAFEGDDEAFRMRVVDGQSSKEEHHTPMIADHMKYLVLRPFWNLPVDIAKKDLLPHMEKSSGYLAEHNYETVNNKGEEVPASIESIAHGGVLVRQKPGPKNSLGLVKFMFPNQFNVYLHDTDAHALFDRTRRDYSHGCVRVQDPPKLADWLLRDNSNWDADKLHDAMNDETIINKTVSLPHPIPIVLFYGTAYVDGGEIHFFQDLYGYDQDLENTVKKGPPYPKKPSRTRVESDV